MSVIQSNVYHGSDVGLANTSTWDASGGSFPSDAINGSTYRVTVAGTVDSESFDTGDLLVAIVDDASTSTYASNWIRVEGVVSGIDSDSAVTFNATEYSFEVSGTERVMIASTGSMTTESVRPNGDGTDDLGLINQRWNEVFGQQFLVYADNTSGSIYSRCRFLEHFGRYKLLCNAAGGATNLSFEIDADEVILAANGVDKLTVTDDDVVAEDGIGMFGVTPPASQPSHIAGLSGSSTTSEIATAVNSILAVLENNGSIATS